MTSEAVAPPRRPLEPEDDARANFYAMLGRLFASAPDARLLAAIANAAPLAPIAATGDVGAAAADLAAVWNGLRAASAATDPDAVAEEFQSLFIGIGRSEVSPYASHYLGPQSGRPLAEIRAALAGLGLARQPGSSEYEDHLAMLLETMRMLVSGDADRQPAGIAQQREFFELHIASWVFDCCTAIGESSVANFYRHVAQFTRGFLALERESLAME